jgi:hypothetical protein
MGNKLEVIMTKYGKAAGKYVQQTMREHNNEGKFQSDEQAIAVGLSKARQAGVKVPKKSKSD